jgi:hypothetical protein
MPDNDLDPGANTQMFQAFVDRSDQEESGPRSSRAVWAGVALAVLVVVVALAWLVVG